MRINVNGFEVFESRGRGGESVYLDVGTKFGNGELEIYVKNIVAKLY
jgi:hypothetical protein